MSSSATANSENRRADAAVVIPGIGADGSLYPIDKLEAHRRGVLHLAISVFVFCGPALMIQRRAEGKYHSGGQWANTCCTHPDFGEDLPVAAVRRLREELGLELDQPLRHAAVLDYRADVGCDLIEHERVHVYRGDVASQTVALALDPSEVAEVAWVEPAELARDARLTPARYTPWLRIYLERWPELRLD
ncbi:MAG: NUDIX domain-containing protein [Hyphomicrobiaceae bacterium]|nr:NUDIX domain-containing protein [Hyphomicrobiaceae bacterium]